MNAATRVFLSKNHFGESEKKLVESGDLSASVFRYSTGVAAVRASGSTVRRGAHGRLPVARPQEKRGDRSCSRGPRGSSRSALLPLPGH